MVRIHYLPPPSKDGSHSRGFAAMRAVFPMLTDTFSAITVSADAGPFRRPKTAGRSTWMISPGRAWLIDRAWPTLGADRTDPVRLAPAGIGQGDSAASPCDHGCSGPRRWVASIDVRAVAG